MKSIKGFAGFASFAVALCLGLPAVCAVESKQVSLMKEGVAAYTSRQWAASELKFKGALAEKEKSGKEDKELQVILAYLAATSHEESKLSDAETYAKRCVQLSEKIFGVADPETAKQYRLLATIKMSQYDAPDAEKLLLQSTHILEKAPPSYLFNYLRALYTLEQCYLIEKKYDQAVEVAKQKQAWMIKNSPRDLLTNLSEGLDLAAVLTLAGKVGKAHEVYKGVYLLAKTKPAETNIDVLIRMKVAANAFVCGDYSYSENTILELLGRHPLLVSPKPSDLAVSLPKKVKSAKAVNDDQAKSKPKPTEKELSAQHQMAEKMVRSRAYLLLAQISAARGDSEKFGGYLEKAKEFGTKLTDKGFPQPLLEQATLYAKLGNRQLAESTFKLALAVDEKIFGKTSSKLLVVIDPYANFLLDIQDSKNLQSLTLLRQEIVKVPDKKNSH